MVSRPARVQPQQPPAINKIKVCLLGDSQTGKTAFAKVFAQQAYPDSYENTIGSDFYMRTMEVT